MDAYSFLLRFAAKTHEPFSPEDVSKRLIRLVLAFLKSVRGEMCSWPR